MSAKMKLSLSCALLVTGLICGFCRFVAGQPDMDIMTAIHKAELTRQKSHYLSKELRYASSIRNKYEHISAIGDNWFAQNLVVALESYRNEFSSKHASSSVIRKRFANISELCLNDSLSIIKGIQDGELWPLNMIDALGKLPSGVLQGNFRWLGSFSQCRNVTATKHYTQNESQIVETMFNGQYCLASIGNATTHMPQPPAPGTGLEIGICVPDSCSIYDTAALVNTALYPLPEEFQTLWVSCKSESLSLDGQAYGVIALLSVLAAVMVCATCYDVIVHRTRLARLADRPAVQEINEGRATNGEGSNEETLPTGLTAGEYTPLLGSQGGPSLADEQSPQDPKTAVKTAAEQEIGLALRLLLCFSVVRNGEKILTPGIVNANNLPAVHGIRFLSMSWVILGHVFRFGLGSMNNLLYAVEEAKGFAFQAILNASVSVDSFFLLSGILISYLLLLELQKRGGPRKINWLLVYFHRFWRLTPPYMLIIAIYTSLYRYTSSGPNWPEEPDIGCQKAWWANLLYINNFDVANGKSCIGWTWFLANDMQFFLISPLLLVLLYKTVIGGLVLIVLTMVVNIVVVAVLTYDNNYPADFPAILANPAQRGNWMGDIYFKPWCRIGPYSIGLILGYFLFKTGRRVKLHWLAVGGGWAAAIACNMAVLYGLYNVANGHQLTFGVSAFYASTHRIAWAAGLSWVIFACATGYGGPINSLLSWSALVPLSRLTYMAYLVHPIVIFWYYGSQETLLSINSINLTFLFIGNLVVSYGVAFVASVTLEAPMMALEKILLPRH